ncbi:MAG: MFS transporter [Bryobacteraceae bacterium]
MHPDVLDTENQPVLPYYSEHLAWDTEQDSMKDKNDGLSSRVAFSYPNFKKFMVARFLTTIASEMQSVAVGWQIYDTTHRPLDLGLAGLAQFLPGICLFLVAGHAADRYPRQRILQICYASFAVCSALLLIYTLSGFRSALLIYAVLLLNGTVRAFNAPASQSMVPNLVAKEHFPNAIAWSSSIFQTATIAGPMVGGLLYGFTGQPILVYVTACLAYAGASTLLSYVRLSTMERPRHVSAGNYVVFEGLRYIWQNKLILGAMSLDLFAVLLGGAIALLPVYAREILRVGAIGLGILRSAPGIGAVLMGIVVAHWPLRRRAGAAMFVCVGAFGLFTIVFGISHSLLLSVASLLCAGAADTVSVIVRHTIIQLSTPDDMRGRVSAVNMVFIGASNEVGQFESGLTAQWFGTVPAVLLGGIGTILITALWTILFPQIRELDRLVPEEVRK